MKTATGTTLLSVRNHYDKADRREFCPCFVLGELGEYSAYTAFQACGQLLVLQLSAGMSKVNQSEVEDKNRIGLHLSLPLSAIAQLIGDVHCPVVAPVHRLQGCRKAVDHSLCQEVRRA